MADPAGAEWPADAVSSTEALERGLPGWPAPGEEPPGPTRPVPPGRGGEQRIPRPLNARAGGHAPWADLPAERRRPTVADVRSALASLGPPRASTVEAGTWPGPLAGALSPRPADSGERRARPEPAGRMADGPTPPGPAPRLVRPSAVLAPLYDHPLPDGLGGAGATGAHVVLTRRTWGLRTHQGEVSFPGGRVEPGESPVDGARREAHEEIGLDPATVEIVGELDRLATVTSGSFIVPYVGVLPSRPDTVPSPHEVEAVLHVPLAELLDPAIFREERWTFPNGHVRPITFFELVGDTVWGATAALLRQLLGFVTGTLGRGDLGHP
jgi:8-oxo-dGTP pyrophosphatase MutT (NUDIX family)